MWHAEHTLETTAPPEAIWRCWADPATWTDWDAGLDWVRMAGPLKPGNGGTLKRQGASSLVFTIAQVEEGRSFTLVARRAFSSLCLVHRLEPSPLGTRVTHRLEVKGPMAWWYHLTQGRRFRESLPPAVRMLARMAHRG